MTGSAAASSLWSLGGALDDEACQRVVNSRDPRFDGLIFVAITTTRIYCRPVCPARVTYPERRRFFRSAAEAEHAGYRPCLRCRPELAPGRALCDAVSRLAAAAAQRISAGALNGCSVASLAGELAVSERHLRRALERELGVSPVQLAQTHRLLLAKQLLADTDLSVTRIAFATGFQSLRRFNAVFRERYRMAPTMLRRAQRPAPDATDEREGGSLRLTLAYRPPLAWDALLTVLRRGAIPGAESIEPDRYGRTVSRGGRRGVVVVTRSGRAAGEQEGRGHRRARGASLTVDLSLSLVPELMPLLASLRQMLDLDAEPSTIDSHLQQGGLGALVRQRPGVRLVGAFDGFGAVLGTLIHGAVMGTAATSALARRVAYELGEPLDTGVPSLTRLAPDAGRIADAGTASLARLGLSPRRSGSLAMAARMVAEGSLDLTPGGDVEATRRALVQGAGVEDALATILVMRALHWPDAFPASDRALQRAAGVSGAPSLRARADRWRPWGGYAAMHLWLQGTDD